MRQTIALLSLLLLPTVASAAWDREALLSRLVSWLDSTDCAGCDPAYVVPTEWPWAIQMRFNSVGTTLDTRMEGGAHADLNTRPSSELALTLSYRGYGFSYSQDLSHHRDREFSLTGYGSRWGYDMAFSQSGTFHGRITSDSIPTVFAASEGTARFDRIHINAYYVFNYRRFSYPAALTCTVRQRQSCGSWLAGISYYRSSLHTADSLLISAWDDIRRLSLRSLSIGGGYAHNWVFGRDGAFLLHVSAMPQLSLLHKYRVSTSQATSKIASPDWNMGNGSSGSSGDATDADSSPLSGLDQNRPKISYLARTAFNYNYGRAFAGLVLVWNQHDIGSPESLSVRYNDWSARLFVGVRF